MQKQKNPNKVAAGKKSQEKGEAFETSLRENAGRERYTVVRIPNGARRGGGFIIPIKSPFDFVLVKKKNVVFCDAKTTEEKTFGHSAIKEKQIENLFALHLQDHVSGYIVRFESHNKTVFFNARLLDSRLGVRGSLKVEDGVEIGSATSYSIDKLFIDRF